MRLQLGEWEAVRHRLGQPQKGQGDAALEAVAAAAAGFTPAQMQQFVELCAHRYRCKAIDPGEDPPVGDCRTEALHRGAVWSCNSAQT